MKDENVVTEVLEFEVEIDGHTIRTIKFDLEHINRGWNKESRDYNPKTCRRSNYKAEDIVEFFEQLGFYDITWEEGINKKIVQIRGQKRVRYYTYVFDHGNECQKKMVMDIPKDFENEGIIITIY